METQQKAEKGNQVNLMHVILALYIANIQVHIVSIQQENDLEKKI